MRERISQRFGKQLSKIPCNMWLIVFSFLTVLVRCTFAEVCFCTNATTSSAVYSKRELHSDVIGYVGKIECFYGDYTKGADWVTVHGPGKDVYIRRNDLSACGLNAIPHYDIRRLHKTYERKVAAYRGQVVKNVYRKRFLLDSLHQAQCTFDHNSMCSWNNVPGHDDFDWVLYQSSTPTDGTGPDFDHTLRNASGKYIFIESSAPRSLFDGAWLQSPTIEASGQTVHCFRFWYHMYGAAIGRLDVYQTKTKDIPGNLMWSMKGDQGNTWHEGQVALESFHNYSIIIAGYVGNGFQGDIAVDDVGVSDGYCDVKPPSASRTEVVNSTQTRGTTTTSMPPSSVTKPWVITTVSTSAPGTTEVCEDLDNDCYTYGHDHICVGEMVKWSQIHCRKNCGFCKNNVCEDVDPDCDTYGTGYICSEEYKPWASIHCAKFCNLCNKDSAYHILKDLGLPEYS
ncbi:MAM and LDL-receptor class A domain-containing protein 1-like isoform X2 [Dreissena polymorpha]|uniref:MAM and LDL-receptor class A domain-containing protein 1-like isoform X2 n=1 Tax=Dreissena polymorpha TaxID=45954 RepID=UPI0022643C71|nr:MAM and LDL-receptor class A domain-containing protein 1-like isoform X2 [Dreissena polymorpha]